MLEIPILPVDQLMNPTLFWDVFQKEIEKDYLTSLNSLPLFQSLISKGKYSAQIQKSTRYLFHINSNKVSLYPATETGSGFPKHFGIEKDASWGISVCFESLKQNENLHGFYECELIKEKNKSGNGFFNRNIFKFEIKDVLEYKNETTQYWPWRDRLDLILSLKNQDKLFSVPEESVDFLNFNSPIESLKEFSIENLKSNRNVILKENSGIYETLKTRGAKFRCLALRSFFEVDVVFNSKFYNRLVSNQIETPSYLQEGEILDVIYDKKTAKNTGLCNGLKIKMKDTQKEKEICSLPKTFRREVLSKTDSKSHFYLNPLFKNRKVWIEEVLQTRNLRERLVGIENYLI